MVGICYKIIICKLCAYLLQDSINVLQLIFPVVNLQIKTVAKEL